MPEPRAQPTTDKPAAARRSRRLTSGGKAGSEILKNIKHLLRPNIQQANELQELLESNNLKPEKGLCETATFFPN